MFARIVKFDSSILSGYAILIFPNKGESGDYIDKNNNPCTPMKNSDGDFKSIREAIATIKKFYHAPRKTIFSIDGECDFDDIRLK